MAYGLTERKARFWAGSCLRKRKYRTYDYAEQKASVMMKRNGVKLRIYYCNECLGFHLTRDGADRG